MSCAGGESFHVPPADLFAHPSAESAVQSGVVWHHPVHPVAGVVARHLGVKADSSNCFQLLSSASTFCPAPSPQPSPGPGSCVWPRWEVDERGVCLFSDPNWFADRWRAVVGLCGCDQTPVPSLETFQAYVTKNCSACRLNGGAPSIPFRPDEVSGAFRVLRFSHCCLKWQVIST